MPHDKHHLSCRLMRASTLLRFGCLTVLALTGCDRTSKQLTIPYVVQQFQLGELKIMPPSGNEQQDEKVLIATNDAANLGVLLYGDPADLSAIIVKFPVISVKHPKSDLDVWYQINQTQNPGLYLCSNFLKSILGSEGEQQLMHVARFNAGPARRHPRVSEAYVHGTWKLEIEYQTELETMNFMVVLTRLRDGRLY